METHRYTTWYVHDYFTVCVNNVASDSRKALDKADASITHDIGRWIVDRANDIITEDA